MPPTIRKDGYKMKTWKHRPMKMKPMKNFKVSADVYGKNICLIEVATREDFAISWFLNDIEKAYGEKVRDHIESTNAITAEEI